MYDRYGYPGLFAAYNAGPARYDEYLLTGRPLPEETRQYLAALSLLSFDAPTRHEIPSGRGLFFELGTPFMGAQPQRPDRSSGDLFEPLGKDRPASSHAEESR